MGPGFGFFLTGRFREASEDLLAARSTCSRTARAASIYEHVTARFFMMESLHYMGGFAELRRLQAEGMRDALERGDRYASVCMRIGHSNLAWLAQDRADLADEHAAQALREWTSRTLHLEHLLGLVGRVHAKLYAGAVEEAHALASEMLRKQKESLLWRVQITRLRTLQHRARDGGWR